MNKEQLETNKAALKLLLNETNDKRTDYEAQITQIEKDLKDLGRTNAEAEAWQNKQDVATRVRELDLQNKLDTIKRIADYGKTEQ